MNTKIINELVELYNLLYKIEKVTIKNQEKFHESIEVLKSCIRAEDLGTAIGFIDHKFSKHEEFNKLIAECVTGVKNGVYKIVRNEISKTEDVR